jgi:beta-fructofuranosidase
MTLNPDELHTPHSVLTEDAPEADFAWPSDASSFAVRLTTDLEPFVDDHIILDILGVLTVQLRQHDPADRDRQNYPAYTMPDASVPVLEATVTLHSDEHPDWREMTIGFPLAMLETPEGEHDILLVFSGVRWTVIVDGEVLDNDFPFGYPRWPDTNTWRIDGDHVSKASLYVPAIVPETTGAPEGEIADIQYWTPPGHNCWVGDVATFYHLGRYHVFYLYDRRHHKSKFGTGGHYFEHLSTSDFATWIHHDAPTPIEAQWETIGTGTPFEADGKLCLAYGLHTERIYPDEKTTFPAQRVHLDEYGHAGTFGPSASGTPIGATWAVSQDGVTNFEKTWLFFHPCRNPSVYRDPDGELRMCANHNAKGTWLKDRSDGNWRCIDPEFPPGGDCTFFFRWGDYDYVIGGFTDLWVKPIDADSTAYRNLADEGIDLYDGLNVPAVTEIANGRFLMAGWTHIRGWGGNLVIRELIQFPDGRIGSKWLDEVTPGTGSPKVLSENGNELVDAGAESFTLTFNVEPDDRVKGRLAVVFLPEDGDQEACELQICLEDQRAQFGPGSLTGWADRHKSLREGGRPHRDAYYAVEQLRGVDGPFTVRVIVKGDQKLGGSLIDVEIAGQRTMISYRPELDVAKLLFRTDGVMLGESVLAVLS